MLLLLLLVVVVGAAVNDAGPRCKKKAVRVWGVFGVCCRVVVNRCISPLKDLDRIDPASIDPSIQCQ